MDSHSENTKRIARNTLMLYVRMLFSMLVSLYTSRVVLNTLGVEDYGIYNVVGGLVAMFSLVSNSLSSSVSRFLTFELGKGNKERIQKIFSTSLLIHIVLAFIILVVSESIGIWFLNNQMDIPKERLYAANWVFQTSVVGFVFSLTSVPYSASIISHEKMGAFAYINIIDIILRLLVVLFIAYSICEFDKLIVYSLLLLLVGILLRCIYLWYCRKNFEECRFRLCFDRQCWKEMSVFAGWNFIGCTAGLLKEQGVNILFNLFIGPVANASRGIASSVNTAVSGFAGNFMTALNPQIIKSYASKEYDYTILLAKRGARFSFYIIMIFALPILFETDFVLTLWLKQYPVHTVSFVRLILVLSLCDILSNTLINMQMATGKIRNYQLIVGGIMMMNFPLSYICLELGFSPESTFVVAILISLCCLFLRLLFLHQSIGLSIYGFIRDVCMNVFTVTAISSLFPLVMTIICEGEGWKQFVLVSSVCVICSTFTIYTIGCSSEERKFIRERVYAVKEKILI